MPAVPSSPLPPAAPARPGRAPLWRAVASFARRRPRPARRPVPAPRLGLDLEGGTQIVLETRDSDRVTADAESTDRALEVLRGRVDALGVAEPTLARSGERRIIVELPGVQDPREAAEVIGRTAQLGFHLVVGARSSPAEAAPPAPRGPPTRPAGRSWSARRSSTATASRTPAPSSPQTASASGSSAWPSTAPGAPQWRDAGRSGPARTPTGGQRIAILLDEEVISSPPCSPSSARAPGRPPRSPAVHPGDRRRPGHPDQGRRPAGAGRGDRAAHRRRDPRGRRDRRVGRGRRRSASP